MTFTVGKHKTEGDHVAHVLHECDGSPTYLVGYIESHNHYPCHYPMIWAADGGKAIGEAAWFDKFDLAAPVRRVKCPHCDGQGWEKPNE